MWPDLPVLVTMQDEWREKGLVAVGVHVKESVRDDALAICRREKINFPNFETGYVDLKGVDGTPTAFFFDHTGTLVHQGLFAGHEKQLVALLEAAPDWVTGAGPFTHVSEEADRIRARKALGSAAKSLREKAASDDPAVREEAAGLLARLETYAEGLFRRAEGKARAGCPDEALDLWKSLARDFSGDALGDRAAGEREKRQGDPTFKRELEALKAFRQLEATAGAVRPRGRGQSEESWEKRNAAALARLRALFAALGKKYADTAVFQRAGELMRSMGL